MGDREREVRAPLLGALRPEVLVERDLDAVDVELLLAHPQQLATKLLGGRVGRQRLVRLPEPRDVALDLHEPQPCAVARHEVGVRRPRARDGDVVLAEAGIAERPVELALLVFWRSP